MLDTTTGILSRDTEKMTSAEIGSIMVLDENMELETGSVEEIEKHLKYFIQNEKGVLEIYPGYGNCIKLKSKEEVQSLCDMLIRQSQTL